MSETERRRVTRRRMLGETGSALAAAGLLPTLLRPAAAIALPAQGSGPLARPHAFLEPPLAYRPRWRWWWGEPYVQQELADELAAFAGAGFSGAEISFTNTIAGQLVAETAGQGMLAAWGTPAQRQALTTSLQAAKQHGIHIDQTLGYGWPVRTPSTGAGSAYAQQELMYGRTDLTGPQSFDGQVPFPIGDSANSKAAHLIAVIAARVLTPGPSVTAAGTPPAISTILDPSSFTDLTDLATPSTTATPRSTPNAAVISWQVPTGNWILCGIWQRDSGEDTDYGTTATLPGPLYAGTPMDYFNRAAATAALADIDSDQIGSSNFALLPRTNQFYFEDSLENTWVELPWTGDMLAEFRQRRGYDLRRWLPLAFVQGKYHYWVPDRMPPADFDLPDGAGARVRHDFDETVTDLYIDYHLLPFQKWAKGHGGRFRSQVAYGLALDVTRSARAITTAGGLAEDETLNAGDDAPLTLKELNWRFAMDHYRSLVSGAHQTGETMVTDELGATLQGNIKQMFLTYYLDLMDKQWSAGVTRPIIHGYSYSPAQAPWPGRDQWLGLVSESWNFRTFPEWQHIPRLADYWARGAMVLEQGQPLTDLAIYRDGFVSTQAGPAPGTNKPFFDGQGLEQAGYRYGYIDPNGLLDPRAAGSGLLYPRSASYRALVIDERALPGAVAQAVASAARGGLAVVFIEPVPSRGTSYASPAAEDQQVTAAINGILGLPNVRVVASQGDVRGALQAIGVQPDAAWSDPVPVYSQHRRDGNDDYFYIWNADQQPHAFIGTFAAAETPYALDLWSGAITPVAEYSAAGGSVAIPLTLAANESRVLAFRAAVTSQAHVVSREPDATRQVAYVGRRRRRLEVRSTRRERHTRRVRLSTGRHLTLEFAALPAPLTPQQWALTVEEMGPMGTTPHHLTLANLDDWRNISAIVNVSGVGTYTTMLSVPASWIDPSIGATLDLGTAHGSIQAYLNGSLISPAIRQSAPFDVTPYLRAGDNEIKVVLTTTLANELVYQTTHGYPAGAASGGLTTSTQAYGLIGPVSLNPYSRAQVA